MAEEIITFACPYCGDGRESTAQEFDNAGELKSHLETAHAFKPASASVWGREVYPPPQGVGFIEVNDMKCVGCGLCAEACSMQHFGVINKDFARIYVRKLLLPLPKAVAVTCCQCESEERPCQQACPVTPPAIHFDEKTLHMVVDAESCTGCLSCQAACASEAIRLNPEISDAPLVCDLCDVNNTGERDPQCVQVCPTTALYYHNRRERERAIRDTFRKSSNEKAAMIARRLYPLTQDSIAFPPWKADPKEQPNTRKQ